MGKIGKYLVLLVAAVSAYFIFMMFGNEKGELLINSPTEILSKPFPLNHPYQNSQGTNEILKTLQQGEKIHFSAKKVDKDFAYYVVDFESREAYIIFGNSFEEKK